MRKVLIIDGDAESRSLTAGGLRAAGFEPVEAETGAQALSLLQREREICLVLTEMSLSDEGGAELCRRIREADSKIGIIILSLRADEADKLAGLLGGADDYVTKPFSAAELAARLEALYRRIGSSSEDGVLTLGPFRLNTKTRVFEKNGEKIRLTQIEYAIIELFMRSPGLALSREEILTGVWGREYFGELKIVDVNIRRLRIKLEDDPTHPEFITTVWGFGYRWEPLARRAGETNQI